MPYAVSKDFLAQTGDPTATGTGGESIWSLIAVSKQDNKKSAGGGGGDVPRYFAPEIVPHFKHTHKGTVSMAVAPALEGQQQGGCGSQFFITLTDRIDYLDGKHAVFGHVVEGLETLDRLNDVFTDQDGRPLKDVRIRHVEILDDPFPDPPGLVVPSSPPTNPPDDSTRIAEDEDPLSTLPEAEEEKERRARAAAASALTLEMVGDLPFANVRPPENVLFVCKLNPVTRDEDLELIFSRFGPIMSCQVIRDKVTGDSLQYAFIEFDKREDAEQAYFKMQNVLIDDRRIWVDFSQSVAKLNTHWSNDVKMGPRANNSNSNNNNRRTAARGGFAGKEDLEPTRRYRVSDENDDGSRRGRGGGDEYGMVFDVRDAEREYRDRDGGQRRRRRSRSPRRDRDRDGVGKRRRSGSRDRERDRERYRERERYEDRAGDHERRRSRSRDRNSQSVII
ncbi:cyclophilin-like protein [Sanghuangporus baumii]|uniref:Peptidyl-prolyl cis-trans isomerase n=1 Tax=Sanghuangporus baumii TaxID=108892 RepID=A0A9Q5I3V3_SANBA|nr:cyclophilin-like protein [Sanghuangporus baumii]